MTPERLEEIRARHAWRNSQFTVPHDQLPVSAHTDCEQLLAEVERLQAEVQTAWSSAREANESALAISLELTAAMEIVQAVATKNVLAYEGDAGDNVICPFCNGEDDWRHPKHPIDGTFIHEPTCKVMKARAILAADNG